MKVAAVTGDDVTDLVRASDPVLLETGEPFSRARHRYHLDQRLSRRRRDRSRLCGGCRRDRDRPRDGLARSRSGRSWRRSAGSRTISTPWRAACSPGHLLECGGQATGGYFAEPGLKDVPDVDRIGFPIAEVRDDRSITITKPPGSGGRDRSPHHRRADSLRDARSRRLHHARRDARRDRSRSRRDRRATR